ncbi:hypothetical protein JF541_18410 [Marinobacter hydrocarbonoclasticus]|uniref:hypothetical protein n=1 Tax=Marinobacter nauticus TaxID=2743 RepID=UPI001A908D1B|nr:hypothetical protein [Marinobacter nauticus]MBN8241133.1 hypothetical protein [Marinobacter nauticus]
MKKMFKQALKCFVADEAESMRSGVSERMLCARLGIPLERLARESGYKAYYADVEYNRKQDGKIKTILDGDYQEIQITCDLILHSRGAVVQKDNLIAVEMKKSNRPEDSKNKDRNRLRALTKESYDDVWSSGDGTLPEHVCGYSLGVFIDIDLESSTLDIEYYKKGEFSSSETCGF